MKKLIITSILALLLAGGGAIRAQERPGEYLGLPGDNLNLYAVMNLFQESETIEGFERSLNDEESRINNLDLNGDNLVDYITVSDYVDGDVHNIVLRVALNRNEYQDVAVFTVQKFRDGSVQIQLIGDEALYGKNYIIEPIYAETPNPGYMGSRRHNTGVTVIRTTYYDIAVWPVVRFIYHPSYVVWRSAWYWGYWPAYWYAWRPWYWHYYYGYHYNWYPRYYAHYHRWPHYRYPRYNDYYYSKVRVHSPIVAVNINKGYYKSTYSRPEQRKEGEAFYARVHSGQSAGTRSSTAVSGQSRRSSSLSAHGQAASTNNTGATRRTTSTVRSSYDNSRTAGQNTSVSRRSTTTPVNRSIENKTSSQITGSTRRTTVDNGRTGTVASGAQTRSTTVTRKETSATINRNISRSTTAGQGTSSTRRASATISASSSSRPVSVQSRASAGSVSRSSSGANSSVISRSSKNSNAGTTAHRSSNTTSRSSNSKESERSQLSRR